MCKYKLILAFVFLSALSDVLTGAELYRIEPFSLRTPLTLDQGQLNLNVNWNKGWFYDSNDLRVVRVPIRLTYGWTDHLEIDFEFPWQEDNSDTNGIAFYEIGAKFKVIDQMNYIPSFAIRASLGFGGDNKLFESHGASRVSLEGLFYMSIFGGEGYMNVGYTWRQSASNYSISSTPSWGLAYQRPLGPHSVVEGSIFYQPHILPTVIARRFFQEAEDAMEFMLGVHYRPIERVTLSAGAGLGTLEGSPDAKVSAGINISLGRIALPSFNEAAPIKPEETKDTQTITKPVIIPQLEEPKEEHNEPPTPKSLYNESFNKATESYQNGQYKDAIKYFQKSLEYDKTSIEALNGMGNSYYVLRDFKKAADAYSKGIDLEIPSRSADLHFNLGLCLYQMGSKEEAIKEWKKTLLIDPEHIAAKENLETLE